jgi:Domain of unknown function (DUF3560)
VHEAPRGIFGKESSMNAYEQKQEARRERLEARAERLDAVASAQFRKADLSEEASGIPFGQPILVGHHSERKHRNAIKRADAAMRRGIEAAKAADEARAKAAGVGHGGIASADPDAVDKLKDKLAELERNADDMKRWNAEFRKGGVEAMSAPDKIKLEVAAMIARQPYIRSPFFVANRRAEIKRVKDRIAALEARKAKAPQAVEVAGGVRVVENLELFRVQIIFPGKPDAVVRGELKSRGFRWAPSENAWQRHLNNAGIYAAREIIKFLDAAVNPA